MANTLITPVVIAKMALFHLENNIIMGQCVHREYKNEFVKAGSSVNIRQPVKFVASDGATRVNQDVIESNTSITVNKRKHVSWEFLTQDLTLTVEDYSERYIKPAAIALANEIDLSLCQEGSEAFAHAVGTVGTTPSSFNSLADVGARMDNESIPADGQRKLILNPDSRWALANGLGGTGSSGVFNGDIVSNMVRDAHLGRLAGFSIFGDQNIVNHTNGAYDGTPLVNGAVSNGATTVAFDGATTNTAGYLKKGDVITIADVYAVNDISKQKQRYLRQFTVTADVTTASNAGSIPVFPTINDGSTASTAAYQTVDSLPADNAAITVVGAASASVMHNLAFHRNALAMVNVPLEMPNGANFKAQMNWRGYNIRVVNDYDIANDKDIIRLDVLWGVKAIYPELGVRLVG